MLLDVRIGGCGWQSNIAWRHKNHTQDGEKHSQHLHQPENWVSWDVIIFPAKNAEKSIWGKWLYDLPRISSVLNADQDIQLEFRHLTLVCFFQMSEVGIGTNSSHMASCMHFYFEWKRIRVSLYRGLVFSWMSILEYLDSLPIFATLIQIICVCVDKRYFLCT